MNNREWITTKKARELTNRSTETLTKWREVCPKKDIIYKIKGRGSKGMYHYSFILSLIPKKMKSLATENLLESGNRALVLERFRPVTKQAWLSIDEVATIIGVTPRTIRNTVNANRHKNEALIAEINSETKIQYKFLDHFFHTNYWTYIQGRMEYEFSTLFEKIKVRLRTESNELINTYSSHLIKAKWNYFSTLKYGQNLSAERCRKRVELLFSDLFIKFPEYDHAIAFTTEYSSNVGYHNHLLIHSSVDTNSMNEFLQNYTYAGNAYNDPFKNELAFKGVSYIHKAGLKGLEWGILNARLIRKSIYSN